MTSPIVNGTEEDLPGSEDRLRLIIDTIPAMAWTIGPDRAVDFINKRGLSYAGISLEQEIEEPTRAIHPEELPRGMEERAALCESSAVAGRSLREIRTH